MTDPLTGSAAHGLAMQPPSVVLESIIVAIQQPPRWILKVVRGPSKFEWREAKIGISASPRGLSVTETRYQHGFTSPSPWWRPTDATRRRWSACSRDRLRWRAGLRGGGGRALGADGDGVAPVGLVEALRVGHAPPYTAIVWRNAAMVECSRSASSGGRACAAGRSSLSCGGRRRRCNLVVKTPLPLSKKVNSEL